MNVCPIYFFLLFSCARFESRNVRGRVEASPLIYITYAPVRGAVAKRTSTPLPRTRHPTSKRTEIKKIEKLKEKVLIEKLESGEPLLWLVATQTASHIEPKAHSVSPKMITLSESNSIGLSNNPSTRNIQDVALACEIYRLSERRYFLDCFEVPVRKLDCFKDELLSFAVNSVFEMGK